MKNKPDPKKQTGASPAEKLSKTTADFFADIAPHRAKGAAKITDAADPDARRSTLADFFPPATPRGRDAMVEKAIREYEMRRLRDRLGSKNSLNNKTK